jgi:hypothetical protein
MEEVEVVREEGAVPVAAVGEPMGGLLLAPSSVDEVSARFAFRALDEMDADSADALLTATGPDDGGTPGAGVGEAGGEGTLATAPSSLASRSATVAVSFATRASSSSILAVFFAVSSICCC